MSGLERFETLLDQVVTSVDPVINPKLLLASIVRLEYIIDLGGDSREAILEGLGLSGENSESDKLGVFNRPCHVVGLRLRFPAYRLMDDDSEGEG